jgi:uncharacterized protein YkwD
MSSCSAHARAGFLGAKPTSSGKALSIVMAAIVCVALMATSAPAGAAEAVGSEARTVVGAADRSTDDQRAHRICGRRHGEGGRAYERCVANQRDLFSARRVCQRRHPRATAPFRECVREQRDLIAARRVCAARHDRSTPAFRRCVQRRTAAVPATPTSDPATPAGPVTPTPVVPTPPEPGVPSLPPEVVQLEARMVAQLAQLRAGLGRSELIVSPEMSAVARAWSAHLVDDFRHNPDYATQIPAGATNWGENIGASWGPSTGADHLDAIFGMLVNSPGHYANMTNNSFTHVGIGVYVHPLGGVFVTQVFARYPAPGPASG